MIVSLSSDDFCSNCKRSSRSCSHCFTRRGRLRLASAGLTVTTGATLTTASGLLGLIGGLGAVVLATGVAVTESCVTRIYQLQAIFILMPLFCKSSNSIDHIPASLPAFTRPPRRLLFSRGVVVVAAAAGASLGPSRLPWRGAGRSTARAGGAGGLLGSSSGSLPAKIGKNPMISGQYSS